MIINNFPYFDDIPRVRIKNAIWSVFKIDQDNPDYDVDPTSKVWIRRIGLIWSAGLERGGSTIIGAAWPSLPDGSLNPKKLLETFGELSSALHLSLTDFEKSERIWTILSGEADQMVITHMENRD